MVLKDVDAVAILEDISWSELADLPIDHKIDLLFVIRQQMDELKDVARNIESTLKGEMLRNDATRLLHDNYNVVLKDKGVRYDPAVLDEILESELLDAGIFAEMRQRKMLTEQVVERKWNLGSGNKGFLTSLGTKVSEIIDRAKVVGYQKIEIEEKRKVIEENRDYAR